MVAAVVAQPLRRSAQARGRQRRSALAGTRRQREPAAAGTAAAVVVHSSMDRGVRVMGEVPVFSSHSSRVAAILPVAKSPRAIEPLSLSDWHSYPSIVQSAIRIRLRTTWYICCCESPWCRKLKAAAAVRTRPHPTGTGPRGTEEHRQPARAARTSIAASTPVDRR